MRISTFKRHARYLVGALAIVAASGAAHAAVTDSFTATYEVSYGFINLGRITFKLRPAARSNCYIYSGHADPNAIVSMLIGELSDKSRFCITDQGTIKPLFFRHHEEGDPEDSYTLRFDWKHGTVRYQNRNGNIRIMSLPDKALDPLSLTIAARLWLAHARNPAQLPNRTFTLVDENEIKQYTLAVAPGGTVTVPAGRYDTLLLKRIDDDDEHLRFRVAKYADWLPVRIEHEEDGRVITMELVSVRR